MQPVLSECRPAFSAIDVTNSIQQMQACGQQSQHITGVQQAKRTGDEY